MFLRFKKIIRTKKLITTQQQFYIIEKTNLDHKKPQSSYCSNLTFKAGIEINTFFLLLLCILSGLSLSIIASVIFSKYFLIIFFILGSLFPISYIQSIARKRATSFSLDYTQFLLAMSSNLKVGLTPYQAMDKAAQLLEQKSLMKVEITSLLRKIEDGRERELAISEFAQNIDLDDLNLFRSALNLVLENGGQFVPTLQRLAQVSNSRHSLFRQAEVSTANMRLTANILLFITPMIILIISINYKDYWSILIDNSVANNIASAGALLITLSYLTLKRMSRLST